MLPQELVVEINVLHRQGKSIRAIAKELGVSRNTVRRSLRGGSQWPSYGPRAARGSKLDAYKGYIHERIEAAKPHWIPATVMYREIQSLGYAGKEGIVRKYLHSSKPSKEKTIIRFETAPGQQLQIDFTTIRRGRAPLKAFVATLGYSRACYVRFSEHERQQDWLEGIEQGLYYFGGVPQELLFDNAKCLLIERDAYGEGQHRWNSELLALAQRYGFRLRVCRPYRAQTKGKVERFNGYLKGSFITPLTATLKQTGLYLDAEIANGQVGPWLAEVAHQRIHHTTREKPQILLEQERMSLQPLPAQCPVSTRSTEPKLNRQAIPVESLQHPLSLYDQLLEVIE
jgi:transposase